MSRLRFFTHYLVESAHMAKLFGLLSFGTISALLGRAMLPVSTVFSIVLFHLSLNFFGATVGMFLRKPQIFGKRVDGTLRPWSYIVWYPWILMSWLSSQHVLRKMIRYPVVSEVHERIFVGGYLGAGKTLPSVLSKHHLCVIDVTCELPRSRALPHDVEYLNIATWDGTPPTVSDIQRSVEWAIERHKQGHAIYVHCAFGIGRSATIASAIIVGMGIRTTWQDAFAYIQEQRPVVRLNAGYKGALIAWTKFRETMNDN